VALKNIFCAHLQAASYIYMVVFLAVRLLLCIRFVIIIIDNNNNMLGTFAGAKKRNIEDVVVVVDDDDVVDGDDKSKAVKEREGRTYPIIKSLLPKLAEDLGELSPYRSKACPILGNRYVIWINASLSNIQIQKTEDYYSEQSSTAHLVGMSFSTDDNGHLYVIDVYDKADADMFAHIQDNFQRIVEEVDVRTIILERSKCFDSQLLRLLAAYIEKKPQFSILVILDSPTLVNLEVWRDKAGAAAHTLIHHTCFVNIQPSYDYALKRAENKFRIGISTIDGSIRSIWIDDVEVRDLDILKNRLFGAGGYWGKVLKSLLNQFIENEGMEISGDTLKVHPLTIKLFPEKVLASYILRGITEHEWGTEEGDFIVNQIGFLKENDLTEYADGSDMGGLTKQFLTELGQNLFDGSRSRSIRVDSNFIPYIPSREDTGSTLDKFGFDRDAAANFGKLLCRLKRENGECLSRVISDNFFGILQIYIQNLETGELAEYGSETSMKLNRLIFTNGVYEPLVRFLFDGERTGINREKALDILEHRDLINSKLRSLDFPLLKYSKRPCRFIEKVPLRKSLRSHVDVKELTSKMRQIIDLEREPYMRMARFTFEGLRDNDSIKTLLGYEDYKKNSEIFQGLNLDAQDIISRIRFDDITRGLPVIFKKVDFLKDYILNRASTQWLENFLLCVTGQRNLNAGTRINIGMTTGDFCCSHTCTNTLDIPRIHETPPLDVVDLSSRFLQNLDFLLAQSRRFDIA